MSLRDKTIVLGVTGSIAAEKAVGLADRLARAGAKVEVVMTEAAARFIKPADFSPATGRQAVTDLFTPTPDTSVRHIDLAEAADAVLIAPATANTIARLAGGIADNLLGCIVLATEAPVIISPAMNDKMFQNPVTQENLARLRARGFTIIEPAYGRLASGKEGKGRLPEIETIAAITEQVVSRSHDLAGKRIVVTAGGTREPIDPVRHIGNRSSGKMGYALAEAARDRGGAVTLITASTSLPQPAGVETVAAGTAEEMKAAVAKATAKADALIMAAAVADYRPKSPAKSKIKKKTAGLALELERTPDILSEVKGGFIKVGFAAESENIIPNAIKKLEKKRLDLIVANDITAAGSGFEVDTNKVILIDRQGEIAEVPLMSKREVAERILDRVVELLGNEAERH